MLSLPGGWANLDKTEKAKVAKLVEEFPHDVAEARASPKQLAFRRAFFNRCDDAGRRCGIYVALGGNRGGKSFVCGWLCLAKWIRYVAKDGAWIWCISQTLDRSISGQQREIWEALPRHMFGDQGWDEKNGFGQHRKLVLPTQDGGKCLIEFRSADQDKSTFEQAKLDGTWVDERLPEEIYDRLLARIVDKDGFILYSDIPEQEWQLTRLVEAEPAAGVYAEIFGMEDNRANLPPGAIEQASIRMTEDERKLRIKGQFVVMEGVVYKEFIDSTRPTIQIDGRWPEGSGHLVVPFAIPPSWPKWRMIDYGGTAPTACLWGTVAPNGHIYLYREYYQRQSNIWINSQAILAASGDEKYVRNYIDPAAYSITAGVNSLAETVGAQYQSHGISPLVGWPRVNEMGEHGMVQKVKYGLEHRTIWVFANLTNLRREFKSWKYKVDKEGRPMPADRFDVTGPCHLLDCLKGFVAMMPTFEQCRAQILADPDPQASPYSAGHIGKKRRQTITMRDGTQRRLLLEESGDEEA